MLKDRFAQLKPLKKKTVLSFKAGLRNKSQQKEINNLKVFRGYAYCATPLVRRSTNRQISKLKLKNSVHTFSNV